MASKFSARLKQESVLIRGHVWIRRWSFPFKQLLALMPRRGKLLDVGCGFGYLLSLVAEQNPRRRLIGCDISEAKIQVAKRLLGNYHQIRLYSGGVDLPMIKAQVITLIDVLYLLNDADKERLIRKLLGRLEKKGKLLIAIVPKEVSWRYWSAWVQEWIMVRLLNRTTSQAGMINFETEGWLRRCLLKCGFKSLRRYELPTCWPFVHKHILFMAER